MGRGEDVGEGEVLELGRGESDGEGEGDAFGEGLVNLMDWDCYHSSSRTKWINLVYVPFFLTQ